MEAEGEIWVNSDSEFVRRQQRPGRMVKGTIADAAGVRFTKQETEAYAERVRQLEEVERVTPDEVSKISLK